jgi:hypothetical protein
MVITDLVEDTCRQLGASESTDRSAETGGYFEAKKALLRDDFDDNLEC